MLTDYTQRTKTGTAIKLGRLKRRAEQACEWRGHNMEPWEDGHNGDRAWARCQDCGATVMVICYPAPNEIDIGGEALAVGHVDLGHPQHESKGHRQDCCRRCHICGAELEDCLDGELWCSACMRYR